MLSYSDEVAEARRVAMMGSILGAAVEQATRIGEHEYAATLEEQRSTIADEDSASG